MNKKLQNDKAIADQYWINYFLVLEKNLASAVPKPNLPFNCYLDKPQVYSFFLSPTDSSEIENMILPLNSAETHNLFSILTSLLKTLKDVLLIPLQLIFYSSFSTGLVPDQFKMVRVVPIHKKVSSYLVSDYRPISLLSIFNKLIEKLMYNRIIGYPEKFLSYTIISLA